MTTVISSKKDSAIRGNHALFPPFDEMGAIESLVTRKLDEARRHLAKATHRTNTSNTLISDLREWTFNESAELDTVINWTVDSLKSEPFHTLSRGYLGLFNPSPSFSSECADRIISTFNPQICIESHAPTAVRIECHTLDAMASRCGFQEPRAGHFTSGGSEANCTALLCAMQNKQPDYGALGVWAFKARPTIYASADCHAGWFKIAHAAGIGRDAIRLIPTDGMGRMNPASLERQLKIDVAAGLAPTFIIATAGTTNAGMVDPISDCRHLANRFAAWLHVDAAWGGAAIASKKLRSTIEGIEDADSVTIDAHKWFASTMGTGIYLTNQPDILRGLFEVQTAYMPESSGQRDFYIQSIQWSRRFVGLRLFVTLAAAGWSGIADHIESVSI